MKKLKDEAYIIEKQTEHDKRVKALYATDKGTKLVRELNKAQNDLFQDIQKKVGNDWYARTNHSRPFFEYLEINHFALYLIL